MPLFCADQKCSVHLAVLGPLARRHWSFKMPWEYRLRPWPYGIFLAEDARELELLWPAGRGAATIMLAMPHYLPVGMKATNHST